MNQDIKIRKDTFKAVYGVETLKEVSELFRADYKEVKNDLQEVAKVMGLFQKYVLSITFMYSITTMKTNLTLFRNIIKKEGGIHKDTALGTFKIFDIYSVIKDEYDKKLEEKEKKSKTLSFDVEKEIDRVKKVISKKTYSVRPNQDEEQVRSYYIAYLLGLSTGRRFTEVLKTINIEKNKSSKSDEDSYIFTGILKKESEDDSRATAYLLDITPRETKRHLKELRAFINKKLEIKNMTIDTASENDINRIFSKVYNNAVKRISKNKIPNFHELRHYYTIEHQRRYLEQYPSLKDSMDSEETFEAHLGAFRRRVLGHRTASDSSRPYKTVK